MKVIVPIDVTDTVLDATNIPVTGLSAWDVGTTYAAGNQVYKEGVSGKPFQLVYESVISSNTGIDPESDDGTNWIEIGATDQYAAFDRKISNTVERATEITYTIAAPSQLTGIAFFGLEAESLTIEVRDTGAQVIYSTTRDLVDSSEIVDWFTFFTWDPEFDTETIFTSVPAYTGYEVDITISAPAGTAKIGQIVLGQLVNLGDTLSGTEIGIEDFSTKDRDQFGNAIIVERPFAQTVDFFFKIPTGDGRRVQRTLSKLRALPSVYFAGEDMEEFGTMVFGFFQDFSIPLDHGGTSFATLEIEGLI
ncbi:hypothetical protein [uncultured Ruegeria sp.]|uniref:hypothetical protein n=1 Tax=uncultured Ruegeria sp. TaxID=259304 RepID=UPI00261B0F85|nr:hypothetical protein [uncultured Ruegeria sp.]